MKYFKYAQILFKRGSVRDERQGKIPKASPITLEQIGILELKKKLQRIEDGKRHIKKLSMCETPS